MSFLHLPARRRTVISWLAIKIIKPTRYALVASIFANRLHPDGEMRRSIFGI